MQIGELAALVGLSTRAVRHYHHRGLLPEPARRANGYRSYGLHDAVTLARIRRLTELGLSLDEVQDVLTDSDGRALPEILAELDADLARQEEQIKERRARLGALIARAELDVDSIVPADLADLLGSPQPSSPMATMERELLALLDTTSASQRSSTVEMLRDMANDPAMVARGMELHRRLDELADAPTDDPRVAELAAEFADIMPGELPADMDTEHPFSAAVLDAMAPAQAEVVRQAIRLIAARSTS